MAEQGDLPRHKFVVGVHNPDVPNPWDYALNHDFDFACTFISRPQLQNEILSVPTNSPQSNQLLFTNALLRPSGTLFILGLEGTENRSGFAYARPCLSLARDGL